jgi:predicted MPP superfamily phosphohydrolase
MEEKMRTKSSKKKIFLLLMLIILTAVAVSIYLDNSLLQVIQYTVMSDRIPQSFNNFKILQLSDLHSTSFGKGNFELLDKIEKQKPDIVVMTGDMVNTKDETFDVFLKFAEDIGNKYETYYVVGNHEQNLDERKQNYIFSKLKDTGIKVLNNQKAEVRRGTDQINLYGMWFNLKYYKGMNNPYTKDIYFDSAAMQKVMGDCDTSKYSILLTHNPLYFDTYAGWGADLTLSGHIHGGMIRIPFKGGLLSPERELFPKYSAGKYCMEDKILIVNRGLGNGDFGIRIFNRPEISVITLLSKQ